MKLVENKFGRKLYKEFFFINRNKIKQHRRLYKKMNKNKITRKSVNYVFNKIECWKCDIFYHRVIMTKYHGILCKKCYQELYEEAKKTFFYFVSALGIEFDTPLNDKTKTLEDTFETMHHFWKSYVVETNFDFTDFQECYLEEIKVVKDTYETLETLK